MKWLLTSLFILLACNSAVQAIDRYSSRAEIEKFLTELGRLLKAEEINKAIELIMKEDKRSTKADAYRAIGTFYKLGSRVDLDLNKAIIFFDKGCKLGDQHSCREKGIMLFIQGNYDVAEKVLLDAAKKYNDSASMGKLVDLYRIKNWSGTSEVKAQYWLHQIK